MSDNTIPNPQQTPPRRDSRNIVIAVLSVALIVVLVILLIVVLQDDDDDSEATATSGATTSTTGAGDTSSTTSGGGLPSGEYQYTLTLPTGTVQFSGSCNAEGETLTAEGRGAQNETISITANIGPQTGGVVIAALGLEGEGDVTSITVGDGTFSLSGGGSVADDSAEDTFEYSVSGSCSTGTTSGGGLPSGEYQYTLTLPTGTVQFSGSCNAEGETLTAEGRGAQNETISITANIGPQTGEVNIAALGVEGRGDVISITVGDGTFSLTGSGTVADEAAEETVDYSVSGSCSTG